VAELPPAARHVAVRAQPSHELWYLFRRVLQVCIKGDDDCPARDREPRRDGRMLPEIALQPDAHHLRALCGSRPDRVPRVIPGAVIDEDELPEAEILHSRARAIHERGDVRRLVEGRYHDR